MSILLVNYDDIVRTDNILMMTLKIKKGFRKLGPC